MNAHAARGRQLLELKKYDLAEKELLAALGVEPNDSNTHALLAACLLQLDSTDRAKSEAATAVALDPDNGFALYTLSRVHLALGERGPAREMILSALRCSPSNADYHYFYALQLHIACRYAESLTASESGLRYDPENVYCANQRVETLFALNRLAEANAEVNRILSINPEFAWSFENKARIALHQGEPLTALQNYREALRLNPHDDGARRGLIESLKSRNPIYRAVMRFYAYPYDEDWSWVIRSLILSIPFALFEAIFRPRDNFLMSGFDAGKQAFIFWGGSLLVFKKFGDPLFTCLLRFDKLGKLALSPTERRCAEAVVLCVISATGFLIAAVLFEVKQCWLGAAGSILLTFPLTWLLSQESFPSRLGFVGLQFIRGLIVALPVVILFYVLSLMRR